MTSADNQQFVTVEVFNNGVERLERHMDELKAEIKIISDATLVNSTKIDDLYHFMGIGFAIIAIVVAFVGFVITLSPMFREMYKDAKKAKAKNENSITEQKVQDMINSSVVQAVNEAVAKAISTMDK